MSFISSFEGIIVQVILTSWHWVPCALGDCTTGEVQWIRPLVSYLFCDLIYTHEYESLAPDDATTRDYLPLFSLGKIS